MSDSESDEEMKAKLAAFMADEGMEDELDSDYASSSDDEKEVIENIPDDLPQNCLDNLVLACCDLKAGMETFEDMTGIEPKKIGSLMGVGTKSARVALDNARWIEIIGPDPNHKTVGMAPKLLEIPKGDLIPYHYTVRLQPEKIDVPEDKGWQKDEITMVHADTETGETSKWDLTFIHGHDLGGIVPQFAFWYSNKAHPTVRLPTTEGSLGYVQVQAPEGHYVHEFLADVTGITLYSGKPKLVFSIETPKGEVKFKGKRPAGIVLPGFDDEEHPSYSGKPMGE